MNKLGVGSALASLKSAALSAVHEEEKVEAVDSVEVMTSYLESIKATASPAVVQVLQMQISVLGTVESPSLVGMTMDNMTDGLKEALEKCDEAQKPEIQRSFARMIQSSVFLAEAKLKYASDKNKKEAADLLAEAGNIMSQSISAVARLADPRGVVPAAVGTVLSSQVVQQNVYGKLGSLFGNRKLVEEKQEEFYKTLDHIFVMLDKYPQYYGKSVIVNGLVAKYKNALVDAFTQRELKPIMDNMSAVQMQNISETVEGLTSDLAKASKLGMVTGLLKAGSRLLGSWAENRAAKSSLVSFCQQYDSYESRIEELQRNVAEAEEDLAELKRVRKDVGFFSFGAKKEANAKIGEQETALQQCRADLNSAVKRFNSLKTMCPVAADVKKEIDAYKAFLDALEAKYAVG